jgi:hypothetical protein
VLGVRLRVEGFERCASSLRQETMLEQRLLVLKAIGAVSGRELEDESSVFARTTPLTRCSDQLQMPRIFNRMDIVTVAFQRFGEKRFGFGVIILLEIEFSERYIDVR